MNRQAGFTLIEAMMAGAISLVIPGVLIAVMSMSNREIGSGAASGRMSQVASEVSDALHRAGLAAAYVYSKDETDASKTKCAPGAPVSTANLSGIIFCDDTKTVFAGFRAGKTEYGRAVLESLTPGTGWAPMVFAGDTVKVTLDPDADEYTQKAPGLFGIETNGAFGWANFRFDMTLAGAHLIMPLQTQSVVCRNATPRLLGNPTW